MLGRFFVVFGVRNSTSFKVRRHKLSGNNLVPCRSFLSLPGVQRAVFFLQIQNLILKVNEQAQFCYGSLLL